MRSPVYEEYHYKLIQSGYGPNVYYRVSINLSPTYNFSFVFPDSNKNNFIYENTYIDFDHFIVPNCESKSSDKLVYS